jgi:hypothetical protein
MESGSNIGTAPNFARSALSCVGNGSREIVYRGGAEDPEGTVRCAKRRPLIEDGGQGIDDGRCEVVGHRSLVYLF